MNNTINNKLKTKDLINIGIFGAIYLLLSILVATLGMIPIMMYAIPFVMAILGGTIVMLFMAKVQKPWALFILGLITPLVMFAMGHTFIVPLVAVVFLLIAEFIARKGKFKSIKYNALAYAFFSCWITGSLMQIILLQEQYVKNQVGAGLSDEIVGEIVNLITWPAIGLIMGTAFFGGFLGAYIGKAMLKKHFEKAGIVQGI